MGPAGETYCSSQHQPVVGSKGFKQPDTDKTSKSRYYQGKNQSRDIDSRKRQGSVVGRHVESAL
jgi:hypothetical protein